MERIWGGRRLESAFGKRLPPGRAIGESWEIVDRPEAQSVVRQGAYRGRTLHELWCGQRREIFGDEMPDVARFPILAKLLDAREKLSLQVHPEPGIAATFGGETKSEMWYFLAADAGAEIHAGLRRGVERSQFAAAIQNGDAAGLVHRLAVKKGDAFFVPSGRLHALGAGNLLVEIQQNSDTTYRVFDWHRAGNNGPVRPLQVEESMQAINFHDFEPELIRAVGEQLLRCSHFVVDKWDLQSPRPASQRRTFALFVCLSGAVEANGLSVQPGEFFLVPASAVEMQLRPTAPETALLRVTLPAR
jgi:mannose-6-phosphate isomerase